MTTVYHPDLTNWLQLSGQYIVQNQPVEERVPWVLFLLDEMKQFMPPEEYATMLRQLQAELGARLEADEV